MTVDKLNLDEYNEYFAHYINLTPKHKKITEGLIDSLNEQLAFFNNIPVDKLEYRYKLGKWSIKEILNHITDTERIFNYRALRIARRDKTPVSGFNENDYATNSFADSRSFKDILEEYKAVRQSTILLFSSFTTDMLLETGVINESLISVRALGFILVGHEIHHTNIIKERYLF